MKKILIVVDMQNDFIDGALGTKEAVEIVGRVKEKICKYRSEGNEIIFTKDTHKEDYLDTAEGRKLPVAHCIKGTSGWEICRELKAYADENKIFEKGTFGSVDVAEYLFEGKYEEMEFVGLCTDICVISNVLLVKAYLPEMAIRVDADCCAGVTPESHRNALEAMEVCQIDVAGDV